MNSRRESNSLKMFTLLPSVREINTRPLSLYQNVHTDVNLSIPTTVQTFDNLF